ncbi:MAG: MerC domain-containing protein [Rhodovibrionaceae bacterium]
MNFPKRRLNSLEWAGLLSVGLAVLACYGTSLVIIGLSLLGVTLVIDEGVWAASIAFLTFLAFLGIAAGYFHHRRAAPVALATIGAAAVIWSMFGVYDWIVELGGLGTLVIAAGWDWRLKKSHCKREMEDAGKQL